MMSSCLTYKEIVNFKESTISNNLKADTSIIQKEIRLAADDVVQIFISSYNKEEAYKFNLLFNQSDINQSYAMGSSIADPFGYRVDNKGNIEMPVLGRVYVLGMTMEELRDEIFKKTAATNYLKEFSVNVRFLSFHLTILGEVNSPGTYTITSQKINVLQAIGLAKDVSLFSKRNNVIIIREQNGKRTYGKIDLGSKQLFQSPWYYLQPNDIIYVEPHRAKILSAPDPASRYISTIIALVSLVFLIIKK
jgi:polysaccharide export outer membrane protein